MRIKICHLSELDERESFGVETEQGPMFVVLKEGNWYAYRNQCPHLGISLDFVPHQFLSPDKSMIQCAMHGALFEKETGLCVSGPCEGQSLQPLLVIQEENHLWLSE